MTKSIAAFSGEHRFLSNFHLAEVEYDHVFYPTVEHAYQAAKTLSTEQRKHVLEAVTPGVAKRRGREVLMRENWEEIKLDVMYKLVYSKFAESAGLQANLFDTGDVDLVEGNYWNDTFWGVCHGVGENHLGKILMRVRTELRVELEEA